MSDWQIGVGKDTYYLVIPLKTYAGDQLESLGIVLNNYVRASASYGMQGSVVSWPELIDVLGYTVISSEEYSRIKVMEK